jgi:hypothetical protein
MVLTGAADNLGETVWTLPMLIFLCFICRCLLVAGSLWRMDELLMNTDVTTALVLNHTLGAPDNTLGAPEKETLKDH